MTTVSLHLRAAQPSPVLAVALMLGTVFIHWTFWDVPSPDVTQFLTHWYRHLADAGLVEGFSEPFGNYSPPYLYLLGLLTLTEGWLSIHDGVRLLSVAGSLLLGLSTFRLLHIAGAPQPLLGGLWTPILPTVFANAGLLSQCDALWVAPCLMAVAASVERRHAVMLAWAGLGFAIKGQTAFLAPFLFAVLIQRKVPLGLWLIPPAIFALLMVPAWMAGWPALDLALTYVHQGAQGPAFVSNASNPWTLLDVYAFELARSLVPVGFVLAATLSLGLAWWLRTRLSSNPQLLNAALLSALLVPTLLPKMHERYFLLADLLSFVVALTLRDRRSIAVAILVALGSAMAITGYVAQAPLLSVVSALPTGLALLLVWATLRTSGPMVPEPKT